MKASFPQGRNVIFNYLSIRSCPLDVSQKDDGHKLDADHFFFKIPPRYHYFSKMIQPPPPHISIMTGH